MGIKNLWGDMPDLTSIRTPHEILMEQGRYLEEVTDGALKCKIDRHQKNTLFSFEFLILVPSLNYQYSLLRVTHDIKLFPAVLSCEQNGEEFTANTQEEFEEDLGTILSSEETRVLVRSLVAQSRLEQAT